MGHMGMGQQQGMMGMGMGMGMGQQQQQRTPMRQAAPMGRTYGTLRQCVCGAGRGGIWFLVQNFSST